MPDSNFSTLFDLLPIGAYRSTPDGKQIRANPALVKIDGYDTEAELLAATQNIASEWYVDPRRRDLFKALLDTNGRVIDFVSEVYRHKTRERIWVRVHAHVVRDEQARVKYYEGTVQDITQERQDMLAIEASERRFRALTALSSDWYWELDQDFRFTRLDIGERSRMSSDHGEILGKTRWEVSSSRMTPQEQAQHLAQLQAQQSFRNFEFQNVDTDGRVYWHAIDGEPMFNAAGEFTGYQGIGRDVTERRRQEALIHNLAFHDPLTGIPNRRLLMERLAHSLKLSARQERFNALLFLDLDKFKVLNDERGHAVGDLMLCEVAKRLLTCARQTDTVARMGGDEFVVLLEDAGDSLATARDQVERTGEKILTCLQEPYHFGDHQHQSFASIGAVIIDDWTVSPDLPLQRADKAMYRAKTEGGNRLRFYTPA
jgi:diguanylate cyclase (GGDEF)-like protein/PAS domain S-box-containing protein